MVAGWGIGLRWRGGQFTDWERKGVGVQMGGMGTSLRSRGGSFGKIRVFLRPTRYQWFGAFLEGEPWRVVDLNGTERNNYGL